MPSRRWLIVVGLAAVAGVGAWYWYQGQTNGLPAGIVATNGRLEAERVDVSTKYGGRLAAVLVAEGDLVSEGQIIARMDSARIEAQLREAEAGVRQAEQGLREAHALRAQRQSELTLAEQELRRSETLLERGFATGEVADQRRAQRSTAQAALASAEAGVARAQAAIEAARASVELLEADLVEYALVAPVNGRVQYRLAEAGEVLAAGGKVVSLLNLLDVYMTVYLPTDAAGRLSYGAEARLVFDAAPQYVVPASVTFVASQAQFTPRYVETASEREKLMFRVKVNVPQDILRRFQEIVKAGVPGMAYVRVDPDTAWPETLEVRLPDGG